MLVNKLSESSFKFGLKTNLFQLTFFKLKYLKKFIEMFNLR